MRFTEQEAQELLGMAVEVKAGFKNLPVGTTGWVRGRELLISGLHKLIIEFYHHNFFGSDRHRISVDKRQFTRYLETKGHSVLCPASQPGLFGAWQS